MVQIMKKHKRQTLTMKIQEWYIREIKAPIFVGSFFYTYALLKIYQKNYKVQEIHWRFIRKSVWLQSSRSEVLSQEIWSSQVPYSYLGEDCWEISVSTEYLMILPRVQDSTDCARTCRQYKFLPTVIILLSAQSF